MISLVLNIHYFAERMYFYEENVKAFVVLFIPCKAFCNKFFEGVLSAVAGEKRFYISPCKPRYGGLR